MKMDLYYFEKGHNSMIVDTDKVLCYNTLKNVFNFKRFSLV